MTTKDFLLMTIQAQNPCSYRYLIQQCQFHGFTRGMVQAFNELKHEGLIYVSEDDDNALIVDLA